MTNLGTKRPLPNAIQLREVTDDDLPIFFTQQQDPDAIHMAAFTAKDPHDAAGFMAHWDKILADDSIHIRTILLDKQVVGYVLTHGWFGNLEVTYWLGKAYWGQGIATQALTLFLQEQASRPLYARVAHDNIASRRVLQKCGFIITGADRGFAQGRGQEIEEIILTLA